jgi:hypothetical protein
MMGGSDCCQSNADAPDGNDTSVDTPRPVFRGAVRDLGVASHPNVTLCQFSKQMSGEQPHVAYYPLQVGGAPQQNCI